MKTINIRQTIALLLLCIYFIIKTFEIFNVKVSKNFTNEKHEKKEQKFIYLLDAGHGIINGEKCGYKSILEPDNTCFYEWIFNWNVRSLLASMLDREGIKYMFINKDTLDVPLKKRVSIANNIESNKKKILISIHANASANSNANGFEVYSPRGNYSKKYFYEDKKQFSDTLANIMYQCYSEEFPKHRMRYKSKSQDYKEAAFKIISNVKCYAILTENEFFTNPQMRNLMRTKKFQMKCAKAIFTFIKKIEEKHKKN